MSTRWTPEQYEAWQARQTVAAALRDTIRQVVAVHNVNAAAVAMLPTDQGSPTKAEVRAEKDLHALISAELRRREIRFLHADMRKASTLPVGHPDYVLYLPGGKCVFCEVKTATGKFSPMQREYIKSLETLGYEVWTPRSFEVFRDFLRIALRDGPNKNAVPQGEEKTSL